MLFYIQYYVTVDLSLPNGIRNAPKSGHDIKYVVFLRVWHPRVEHEDADQVDDGAHEEDGHAANLLDDETEAEGADGVAHAEHDDHPAEVLHSVSAANVGLKYINLSIQ